MGEGGGGEGGRNPLETVMASQITIFRPVSMVFRMDANRCLTPRYQAREGRGGPDPRGRQAQAGG